MLTVYAPAKVNLVLEVLGKDANRHRIYSIVQTIDLCDTLNFQLSEEISFKCNEPSLERNNLVIEAATLLKKTTGCTKGVQIKLDKRIPWGAGLGGGSSDAAVTLLSLNKLWGLGLSITELVYLASNLGSDVPFFIHKGTALVGGVGDRITPLLSPPKVWFVLLVPPLPKIQSKTKQLYAKLNNSHFTEGKFVRVALAALKQGGIIDPSLMFNVFEKVAFSVFSRLDEYKKKFEELAESTICLAGSGPTLFNCVPEEKKANELCLRLKEQGLECYIAPSLPRAVR